MIQKHKAFRIWGRISMLRLMAILAVVGLVATFVLQAWLG